MQYGMHPEEDEHQEAHQHHLLLLRPEALGLSDGDGSCFFFVTVASDHLLSSSEGVELISGWTALPKSNSEEQGPGAELDVAEVLGWLGLQIILRILCYYAIGTPSSPCQTFGSRKTYRRIETSDDLRRQGLHLLPSRRGPRSVSSMRLLLIGPPLVVDGNGGGSI